MELLYLPPRPRTERDLSGLRDNGRLFGALDFQHEPV
jgi:hypothetical protein